MPNLKGIKNRIKTVKSTQKITQAMKLVAASKVRKVQQRVLNLRPYTKNLNLIVEETAGSISSLEKNEIPLMVQRKIKSVCLIVISSDRGLCGSYNTNLLKRAIKRIQELEKENTNVKLITIGNKSTNFFRKSKYQILDSFTNIPAVITIELANLIVESAKSAFTKKEVDKVEIIGTDFISMLRSEIYIKDFFPILAENHIPSTEKISKLKAEVLFEPSIDSVLNYLLPIYSSNMIFHALLEAQCSELASRMNAMSSATTNAKDLIDRLTIVYNKARQAAITQEISEIVGGAEALK